MVVEKNKHTWVSLQLESESKPEATRFVAGKMYMGRGMRYLRRTENCFEII